jgi:hypothetical protein
MAVDDVTAQAHADTAPARGFRQYRPVEAFGQPRQTLGSLCRYRIVLTACVSGTDSYEMARRTVYVEPVSGRQNREKYRVNREKRRKLSRPLQEALIYRGFLSFFATNKNRDEFYGSGNFRKNIRERIPVFGSDPRAFSGWRQPMTFTLTREQLYDLVWSGHGSSPARPGA